MYKLLTIILIFVLATTSYAKKNNNEDKETSTKKTKKERKKKAKEKRKKDTKEKLAIMVDAQDKIKFIKKFQEMHTGGDKEGSKQLLEERIAKLRQEGKHDEADNWTKVLNDIQMHEPGIPRN